MNPIHSGGTDRLALKPLAACLAIVLAAGTAHAAVSAPVAVAASQPNSMRAAHRVHASMPSTRPHVRNAHRAAGPQPTGGVSLPVASCADDSSGGTLREVVATAGDGDTVDLSALTCSSITLTQGVIAVGVNNLTLLGPSATALTIDAANASRVINHTGAGTLTVDHLSLTRGLYTGAAGGGCVFSYADVVLTHANVDACVAGTTSTTSFGGGVFATGAATVTDSAITNNVASGDGSGGGVMSYSGAAQITRSTVSGNSGYAGGGVFSRYGNLTIESSTISGNSGRFGGGAYAYSGSTTVTNSTISGNTAVVGGSGIQAYYMLTLHNSTVAFNTTTIAGGGVQLFNYAPDIISSIVANNTAGTSASDLGGGAGLTVTGSNNVIMTSDATTPGDTLTGDPGLQPLANNGGTMQTHALGVGSIALDVGLNPNTLPFDQRGDGFARSAGAATDIGAYEDQGTSDVIFVDGFDGP